MYLGRPGISSLILHEWRFGTSPCSNPAGAGTAQSTFHHYFFSSSLTLAAWHQTPGLMLEIYAPQLSILRIDQRVLSCFQFRFAKLPQVQNVNVVSMLAHLAQICFALIHWFVLCLHFHELCQKDLLLQLDCLVMPFLFSWTAQTACFPSSNSVHCSLLQSARGCPGPVCEAQTPVPDGGSIVLHGNCSERG